MSLPTITRSCYNNLTTVQIGPMTVSFSYITPVAFYHPKTGQVVCENVWSGTTGRHLNEIDGGAKDRRLPRSTFTDVLELIGDGTAQSASRAVRMIEKARNHGSA
jgi:hypothetical protein